MKKIIIVALVGVGLLGGSLSNFSKESTEARRMNGMRCSITSEHQEARRLNGMRC